MINQKNSILNVLHITTKLAVGGVERIIYEEITGYDNKRFRGSACCIMEGGEIAEALTNEGIKVEVLYKMKGHGFDWGAIKALIELIKKENIHVLRTHQYHSNLYGRVAGFLAKVPVIIPTFHTPYVSPDRPKFHRRIINYMLSFVSDALVPVSKSVAADLIKYDRVNQKKIRVISNGIKTDDFIVDIPAHEARKKYNLPLMSTIIGCLGRLTKEKGHRHLIEAVSGIDNICLAFAGNGPLISDLKNEAIRANVNCVFVGELDSAQVPRFLKSLDIYCSPSLWEGFGIALVEAMASGLPIIASYLPSHIEVVGDAGIMFTPGNPEELKNSVYTLLSDSSLKSSLIRKARERARLFSMEKTINSYQELIEDTLKRKNNGKTI